MTATQTPRVRIDLSITRKQLLLCAWSGPALLVLLGAGLLISKQWPPLDPNDSAEETAAFYSDNKTQMRVGLAICMAGIALIMPWGASIVAMTSRIKGGSSALTYTQIAAFGVATIIGVASLICWSVAAFRPDDTDPDFTRGISDLGWFFFVFDWSPLFMWYLAVGLAIFADRSADPIFPRWGGYLSVWVATLSVPGGTVIFFKTGPLAYDGIFGIWIPLGVFFIWIVALSWLTIRAVGRLSDPEPD